MLYKFRNQYEIKVVSSTTFINTTFLRCHYNTVVISISFNWCFFDRQKNQDVRPAIYTDPFTNPLTQFTFFKYETLRNYFCTKKKQHSKKHSKKRLLFSRCFAGTFECAKKGYFL